MPGPALLTRAEGECCRIAFCQALIAGWRRLSNKRLHPFRGPGLAGCHLGGWTDPVPAPRENHNGDDGVAAVYSGTQVFWG